MSEAMEGASRGHSLFMAPCSTLVKEASEDILDDRIGKAGGGSMFDFQHPDFEGYFLDSLSGRVVGKRDH